MFFLFKKHFYYIKKLLSSPLNFMTRIAA